MSFKAISVGCAVPRGDFDATVHSAFRSALNLRLNENDPLITLTCGDAEFPQGIRIDAPSGFSFEIFYAGAAVSCREHILRCAAPALKIDLRGAARFYCDLPSLKADMTRPPAAAVWRRAWQILNERQIQSDAEIIARDLIHPNAPSRGAATRRAGEAMRGLFDAARRYDCLAAAAPLRLLVGLGSGLTPSGDDLLVGYLAGLWCAVQGKNERIRFISALEKELIGLSHRTNDISRSYLYHAAQGQVSSRLANLAETLCRADHSNISAAVWSAMQAGHASGMDAASGLLIGLANWADGDIAALAGIIF